MVKLRISEGDLDVLRSGVGAFAPGGELCFPSSQKNKKTESERESKASAGVLGPMSVCFVKMSQPPESCAHRLQPGEFKGGWA